VSGLFLAAGFCALARDPDLDQSLSTRFERGRDLIRGSQRRQSRTGVARGLVYSLGRALTYVLVGGLVVSSVLSIPSVSFFLQERMNQVLGPLLIVIGIGLIGWLRFPLPSFGFSHRLRERSARAGSRGPDCLGFSSRSPSAQFPRDLLWRLGSSRGQRALACAHSGVYGVGTGLPVVVFAVLLVLGAQWIGRAFQCSDEDRAGGRGRSPARSSFLAGLYLSLRIPRGAGHLGQRWAGGEGEALPERGRPGDSEPCNNTRAHVLSRGQSPE